MADDRGWIKLHRSMMDSLVYRKSNFVQKTILFTILMMANHKEREYIFEGKKIVCQPGQFVTSVETIIDHCGEMKPTRQNVRTALELFKKCEFLTIKSTKRGSLITIINWGVYQCGESEANQQTNQHLTNIQPTSNQHLTINKNIINKEYKNKKKKNKKEKVSLGVGENENPVGVATPPLEGACNPPLDEVEEKVGMTTEEWDREFEYYTRVAEEKKKKGLSENV